MESKDDTELSVVQFESFVKAYEVSSPGEITSGTNRGKYYKQTYRPAWEQMPDFKGWLRGVPGEPTRAFCSYCQKSLHAHRLSLLKHTCTIRHQRAAQIALTRQNNKSGNQEEMSQMESVDIVIAGSSHDEENEELQRVDYETIGIEESDINEQEDVEEEEESVELEDLQLQYQKQARQGRVSIMSSKPVISTHVLDTARGQPVSGLQVSLYKLIDGRWTYINEGLTSPDGRFGNFLSRDDFSAGRYKLHFDVDRYFELRKQDSMYPFIEIVFDCRAPTDHYHIPLLLGPFGYTTYRGT